ncbi:MAG: protein kinase [Planctomycetes bacterium]|nr:protein kinase [Planctomycetota bacterium]
MGTPAYMAPEQARCEAVDARADVFGLGAILCEILTGKPPYQGRSAKEMHTKAEQADLGDALDRLKRCGADRELIEVCCRCLAKDKENRLADGVAVSREIASYQSALQERLHAAEIARATAEVRSREEKKRRRVAIILTTTVLTTTLVGIASFAWQFWKALDARDEAIQEKSNTNEALIEMDKARNDAESARKRVDHEKLLADAASKMARKQLFLFESMLYIDRIGAAQKAVQEHDFTTAHWNLKQCRPEFQHVEYAYLARQLALKELRTFVVHSDQISSLALSADGKLFTGSRDKFITVWDLLPGKEICKLRGHTEQVSSLALSADGKRLFSGSYDTTIRVWDTEVGTETGTLTGHKLGVTSLVLSADGMRLFSGDHDGTIKVWDLKSRTVIRTLRWHTGTVASLVLSADGKRLFSGSYDKTIGVWDWESRDTVTNSLDRHTDAVNCLVLSADGKRLFSGSNDKTIRLWDMEAGKENDSLRGHTEGVSSLAFSADGTWLFSGSDDKTIKVWDVTERKEICTLRGHTEQVSSLALSADGKLVPFSADNFRIAWARSAR